MMLALLLAIQAALPPRPTPEPAPPDIVVQGRQYGACGPRYVPLYVAPMGEPFRTNGTTDPMARWFAQADADRDGRVTSAELVADAQRFFATLDGDGDGELDPQEVSAYEIDVAPEIRLHRPGFFTRPPDRKAARQAKREARTRADYAAPYGAGLNASLNIPEPVASADLDIDRGVSRDEYARVAAQRFTLLDATAQGHLAYATLPRSPGQQTIDACYAKEAPTRR